jgi:LCP family protein required for cell wall assembly
MSPLRYAPSPDSPMKLPDPPVRSLPDVTAMSPGLRRRRAFTLVLLTLALPGSAQLAAGNRRVGRVALCVWLGLGIVAALFGVAFLLSRSLALGLLGRSWFLPAVEGLLAGLAAVWAVLFVDAWCLARPGNLAIGARRWLSVLTMLLVVATSGGLLWASSTVDAARSAVSRVFTSAGAVEPTAGRYNILLLGADSASNRVGTRPDSIQLVSIDEETGRAVTFGFSRDTENINFRSGSIMRRLLPEGWNCGDSCLLNGLYTWATDHKSQFPASVENPGVLATREAVEALSGLDVHYYVMVDLKGFTKMIDALGGLDITVGKKTPIGGGTSPIAGWIQPGRQHMDGYHALWYARSREGSTNYERMARQRCVTTAMLQQLDPQSVLLRFQSIASASSGLLQTDVPQSELGYFADLALRARPQKIRAVNFVPPLMKPWDYDATFVANTVRDTIRASEKSQEQPKPADTSTAAPFLTMPSTTPSSVGSASSSAGPTSSPSGDHAAEGDVSAVCQNG